MKRFASSRSSLVAVVAAAGWLCAAPLTASAMLVNRIVATIDGDPVTLYDVKQFGGQTIRGRDLTASDRSALLDALILNRIIAMEARAQGLDVSESEIDTYIKDVMERNRLDEMQLRQALEAQGIDFASYRDQIRSEVQRQRLIAREIRGKVNISPEEIERYYRENIEQYSKPARVEVAHMVFAVAENAPPAEVLAAKAKADAAYEALRNGGDFAELAAERSDDGGADGGRLGWFKPGELVDSLDEATRGLRAGSYSEPVRGPQGFHIVKVLDREDKGYEALEEHSEEIKEKLYAKALEDRYDRWIGEELRKRHHVETR